MTEKAPAPALSLTPEPLALWDEWAVPDPAYLKKFKRRGGFAGTAIDPMWRMKRATEVLGPVGVGFGWTVLADGVFGQKQPIHWCRISFWYVHPDDPDGSPVRAFDAYGCTAFVERRESGVFVDDEAPKKSLTDAICTALSRLGLAAAVYMGEFDGDKYAPKSNGDGDGDGASSASPPRRPPAAPARRAPAGYTGPAGGAPNEYRLGPNKCACGAVGTPHKWAFEAADKNGPDAECSMCVEQYKGKNRPARFWSWPRGENPNVRGEAQGAQRPPRPPRHDEPDDGPPVDAYEDDISF